MVKPGNCPRQLQLSSYYFFRQCFYLSHCNKCGLFCVFLYFYAYVANKVLQQLTNADHAVNVLFIFVQRWCQLSVSRHLTGYYTGNLLLLPHLISH